MKYPVCSTSSTVHRERLHACLIFKCYLILQYLTNFWAPRMCTGFKWPHVCCHVRCRGNIRSKRWICSLFFRRRRYENQVSLDGRLSRVNMYMGHKHVPDILPPQVTSSSAMLTPWSLADKLFIQPMTSCVEFWAPSGTLFVPLWILYWILYQI